MMRIRSEHDFVGIDNDNRFIGTAPKMKNSSIVFNGANNILYCDFDGNVELVDSEIVFNGNNSIVFLCSNNHQYKLKLSLNNDNVFYMGKDNYINGAITAIMSEQKHVFIGNNCLFSIDVWIRNADPHLVYDKKTMSRVNPTKSIFIGDHVWVGQSAIILKGSRIHSGSIIGAMSLVAGKQIPSNESWGGNPIRKISKNIFWSGECVHRWTSKETESYNQTKSNKFWFSMKQDEILPFEQIDDTLSDSTSSLDDKLDFLRMISGSGKKNRFAYKTTRRTPLIKRMLRRGVRIISKWLWT